MFRFGKKTGSKDADLGEVKEAVIGLVREVGVEAFRGMSLTGESTLEEIGFESMHYLKLIIKLEKYCGASLESLIDDLDLTKVKTVSDVAAIAARFRG